MGSEKRYICCLIRRVCYVFPLKPGVKNLRQWDNSTQIKQRHLRPVITVSAPLERMWSQKTFLLLINTFMQQQCLKNPVTLLACALHYTPGWMHFKLFCLYEFTVTFESEAVRNGHLTGRHEPVLFSRLGVYSSDCQVHLSAGLVCSASPLFILVRGLSRNTFSFFIF